MSLPDASIMIVWTNDKIPLAGKVLTFRLNKLEIRCQFNSVQDFHIAFRSLDNSNLDLTSHNSMHEAN